MFESFQKLLVPFVATRGVSTPPNRRIDSLIHQNVNCFHNDIYLLHHYWKTTGLTGAFDAQTYAMLVRICEVFSLEQHHENSPYSFERQNCVETDTLPCAGRGTPVGYTGMTWSGFRPSDDRCVYGYLIPAQIMAVKALKYAAEMLRVIYLDDVEATKCIVLSNQIETGIQQYGIVRHPPVWGNLCL